MKPAAPLRWSHVGLVATGGALGTAAREGAVLLWPAAGGIPAAVLVVNVLGSLLLGVLFAVLARRPSSNRTAGIRALLGAGALGGFTTYSALAGDTAGLWGADPALAAGYGIVSLVAGVAAAALGLVLGGFRGPRRDMP